MFTFITRELAFYVMTYIYHNFRITINLNIYYLRTKICSRKQGKMTGFETHLIILFIEKMTSQALSLAVVNVWLTKSDVRSGVLCLFTDSNVLQYWKSLKEKTPGFEFYPNAKRETSISNYQSICKIVPNLFPRRKTINH